MSANRWIIHLDLDAFFCAVEEQRNPELRGLPFAVGGRPDERGVVSSCSYAARVFGIHSAMPMRDAVARCPKLVIVSSHYATYREASRKVMAKLHNLTPKVEQISIDEAFLDVTEIPGKVEDLGRELQGEILNELGLPNSLGIASNKLVAKIATDVGKNASVKGTPPNAITFVPHGSEAKFLSQLPVRMLWGVGPKTAEKLQAQMDVETIGELAEKSVFDLVRHFGKVGYDLSQRARGIDTRPIITEHETKSISQEVTYATDIRDENKLIETLERQSSHLARQLVKQGLAARTVKIKLRWPNFDTLTRQTTLETPTIESEVIARTSRDLFRQVWQKGKAVRLLGVGVSGLEAPSKQLGLWDVDWEKEQRIREVMNEIQERFGEKSLSRGNLPPPKAVDSHNDSQG